MYKLMVEFHNFWSSLGQIPTDRKISPINCVAYIIHVYITGQNYTVVFG